MPRSRNSTTSASSATSATPPTPPTTASLQSRWQAFEQYAQTPAATANIVTTLRTYSELSKDIQAMEERSADRQRQWMDALDTSAQVTSASTTTSTSTATTTANLSDSVTRHAEAMHRLEKALESATLEEGDCAEVMQMFGEVEVLLGEVKGVLGEPGVGVVQSTQ